jgi:hypothetical protein
VEKAPCGKKFKAIHAAMQHARHCVKCAHIVQKQFPNTVVRMPTRISARKESDSEHDA